ncbi:arsenate reductase (glutaredoxin) [Rheinheimera maricola]|uniref:Arsenate reductase n=1 Tax=Rheinheimera maricola TaxID=2793282 RepID=A0ABS7XDG7_9GAMM|nr:arsenate reductase (glutaredoxin) [Rheinheimera maricola]MBZ9613591.1 arsenate reductase (glutaredoxin) [Rheinheimera maricola]
MIKILHNPRCSKSREALALLQQHYDDIDVIEYLKTPLSAVELTILLQQLGVPARALIREKESEFIQLGLDDATLSEQQLIEAMVAQPKLIERPVIVKGDKAVIGRPVSNIMSLLS